MILKTWDLKIFVFPYDEKLKIYIRQYITVKESISFFEAKELRRSTFHKAQIVLHKDK